MSTVGVTGVVVNDGHTGVGYADGSVGLSGASTRRDRHCPPTANRRLFIAVYPRLQPIRSTVEQKKCFAFR